MDIRPAMPVDALQVLELAKKFATSFAVESEAFKTNYQKMLGNDGISIIVAVKDEKVVGYCLAFHHLAFFANGFVSWVEELMVDESVRGENVGTLLMEKIEQLAHQKDSRLIALATRRAAGFYEKVGYERSAVYFRKLL